MTFKKIIISILMCTSFLFGSVHGSEQDNLASEKFQIHVSDITPGGAQLISTKAERTIENILKRTIERFIIALGTIALLAMTIGAGYMILYTGEDERLTTGKTIFTSGLIAMAAALLSGLMVQLVAYLLYI